MWILVSFDLPTNTADQRKAYRIFKSHVLEHAGFMPLHESLFYRWCPAQDRITSIKTKIQAQSPHEGKILILTFPETVGLKAICLQDKIEEKLFQNTHPASLL